MSSITGCIMARNEEKLIGGCIQSLKPFVDEIIVVDNGSTDHTKEIALKNGCRVFESPDSDVDKGRMLYVENAQMEWLLILDADERLDETKVELLKDTLAQAPQEVMAFRIPWYNYIGNGKFVETSTAARIVRNVKGIKYNNFSIHASITDSVKQMGGKTENLHFPLQHFDIICGKRTAEKREIYRTKLESTIKDYQMNPTEYGALENIYVQYLFLGVEYSAIGDYISADKNYDIVIESKDSTQNLAMVYKAFSAYANGQFEVAYDLACDLYKRNAFAERVYSIILEEELKKGKYKEALRISEEMMAKKPNVVHIQMNHALLLEKDEPKKALECMWNAINLNPCLLQEVIYSEPAYPNVYSFQCSILSSFVNIYHHLAGLYRQLGYYAEAEYWSNKEKYMKTKDELSEKFF